MKSKSSKSARKHVSAAKPRGTSAKRCECCGDAPCSCPATHLHMSKR